MLGGNWPRENQAVRGLASGEELRLASSVGNLWNV